MQEVFVGEDGVGAVFKRQVLGGSWQSQPFGSPNVAHMKGIGSTHVARSRGQVSIWKLKGAKQKQLLGPSAALKDP